uniref:Uncharacterized protein n=1 Tax=Sphaerodactylus townsendi TaxID=933632 RepID=A0ACB8F756_9SAUR
MEPFHTANVKRVAVRVKQPAVLLGHLHASVHTANGAHGSNVRRGPPQPWQRSGVPVRLRSCQVGLWETEGAEAGLGNPSWIWAPWIQPASSAVPRCCGEHCFRSLWGPVQLRLVGCEEAGLLPFPSYPLRPGL